MSDVSETADVIIVGGGSAGAVLAARLSQDPARTVLLLEVGPAYDPGAYPRALLDANTIADPAHDWGYTSHGSGQSQIPTPRGKVVGGSSAVNAAVALRSRAADFDRAQGFKRVHDFNGAEQNGADGYPVDVVDGVRQNVGLVYLTEQVRRRPNLTIRGDVNVDRVLFDGVTATGVLEADGTVYRGREVILSGGTYGSPAILLRSGVGPADDLAALGIGVVADLPVGQRLQDQPGYYNAYALAPGYLEMSPAVGSLLWTASSEADPDELDLHVTATHLMDAKFSPTGGAIVVMPALTRPESTGTVKLASRDPGDAPLIDANYLGTDRDARRLLEGAKIGRAIGRNPVFAPFVAAELTPGDAVVDDEELARAVAGNLAIYGHPTSSVPMGGPADPWAVVDSVGAVSGVGGLRVVDASIIPEAPSATTNMTVIMLAEHIYQRAYAR